MAEVFDLVVVGMGVGGLADLAGLRVGLAALGGVGVMLVIFAPRIGRLGIQAVGQGADAGSRPAHRVWLSQQG